MSAQVNNNDDDNIKNFVYCLEFLANEANDSNLDNVSKIINGAIIQIINLETEAKNSLCEPENSDLFIALKTFLKFYLMGTCSSRFELLDFINQKNMGRKTEYVH